MVEESVKIKIYCTVVPHIAIASFYNEIALQHIFCDRKSNCFAMFPMGEFRFAMIGSLLWAPIIGNDDFFNS